MRPGPVRSIPNAALGHVVVGIHIGKGLLELVEFRSRAVDLDTYQLSDFQELAQRGAAVLQMRNNRIGILVGLAAAHLIALEGEVVEQTPGFVLADQVAELRQEALGRKDYKEASLYRRRIHIQKRRLNKVIREAMGAAK